MICCTNMVNFRYKYFIIYFTLILISALEAVEIVSPLDAAQRYLNADLVLVGKVLSIEVKIIKDSVTQNGDGWQYEHRKLLDIYNVKIDSILKGSYSDSLILIQSQPYSGHEEKSKFAKIDSLGDSIFISEILYNQDYRGGSDLISTPGMYIILLNKVGGSYISILTNNFEKNTLMFYRKIQTEGTEFLKP